MSEDRSHRSDYLEDADIREIRDLLTGRSEIADRIRRLDNKKDEVKEKIYQKVRSEYDRQLDQSNRELEPKVRFLHDKKAFYQSQRRDIQQHMSEPDDALDEIKLRFELGEFSREEYNARFEQEQQNLSSLRRQYATADRAVAYYQRILDDIAEGRIPDFTPPPEEPILLEDVIEKKTEDSGEQERPPEEPIAEIAIKLVAGEPEPKPKPEQDEAGQEVPLEPEPLTDVVEETPVEPEPLIEIVQEEIPESPEEPEQVTEPEPEPEPIRVVVSSEVEEREEVEPEDEEETGEPEGEVEKEDDDSLEQVSSELSALVRSTGESSERTPRGDFEEDFFKEVPPSAEPPSVTHLVLEDPLRGPQYFEVKKGVNSIGRAIDNDIVLEHPSVSERHARLVYEKNKLTAKHLGGPVGTFVNGARIKKERLQSQDVLRIGDIELLVQLL